MELKVSNLREIHKLHMQSKNDHDYHSKRGRLLPKRGSIHPGIPNQANPDSHKPIFIILQVIHPPAIPTTISPPNPPHSVNEAGNLRSEAHRTFLRRAMYTSAAGTPVTTDSS